jgi:hypothetical protein
MKEFKDYATMVVEEQQKVDALNKKREVAKQRYEERKRLRDEASYEERLLSYARRDENEDIIANIREHFTAEEIANKDYLQNAYESKEDWEQGIELKGSMSEQQFSYFDRQLSFQNNFIMGMSEKVHMLKERTEILRDRVQSLEEGTPSIYEPLTSFWDE